jgi:DNA repair exonuclease SbcCD nuclease subunit
MTRVYHTADVHLTAAAQERRAALRTLLDTAERDGADVVTVGGDLFDQPGEMERLRAALRNDLFSERPFEILLIPGNHDVEAYRDDVFFGDSCTVLAEEPFTHWTAPDGDLRITGLPYRDRPDDELLLALGNREPFDGTEALLLHCSLDAPFDDYETGDEGRRRYFPVTEAVLTELGFDYYLAGHYHSPHQVGFEDSSVFTYPGTPASTSHAETGKRQISVLETGEGLDFRTLPTFHYVAQEFTATPGSEEELLEAVRTWVETHVSDAAEASLRVNGFVATAEAAFHAELTEAAGPAALTDETRSVQQILSHPLYRSFEAELGETDWDESTATQVTQRTLEVFSQLSVQGEL